MWIYNYAGQIHGYSFEALWFKLFWWGTKIVTANNEQKKLLDVLYDNHEKAKLMRMSDPIPAIPELPKIPPIPSAWKPGLGAPPAPWRGATKERNATTDAIMASDQTPIQKLRGLFAEGVTTKSEMLLMQIVDELQCEIDILKDRVQELESLPRPSDLEDSYEV